MPKPRLVRRITMEAADSFDQAVCVSLEELQAGKSRLVYIHKLLSNIPQTPSRSRPWNRPSALHLWA